MTGVRKSTFIQRCVAWLVEPITQASKVARISGIVLTFALPPAILVTEIVFKILEVIHEDPMGWPEDIRKHPQHMVVWVISRRLDDAYFWSVVVLWFAGMGIFRARSDFRQANPSVRAPGTFKQWPIFLLACFSLGGLYIGATWLEPGTFFYGGTSPFIKRLQFWEGILNLLAITLGASLAFGGYVTARSMSLALAKGKKRSAASCRMLAASCLRPLLGFSLFFFAYQVLVSQGLALDELVTVGGSLLFYAGPFLWLYFACKRLWKPSLTVRISFPNVLEIDE